MEDIPLPITYGGKQLWLDDVILLLNGINNNLCILEIFVDGSCNHKKGYGAWAIYSNKFQKTGTIKADNIGYVELYAVYMAMQYVQDYMGDVIIYTDSQYVYSNVNWKAKEYESLGWKSKSWRKRIPNKELLQKIHSLLKPNVHVEKINRRNNKYADLLAKKELKKRVMME